MKIFVEGNAIFAKNRSGIGQYAKRLVEAMLDQIGEDDSITVYGFMPLRPSTWRQSKNIDHPRVKYRFILLPAIVYNLFLKILHIRLPVDLLMFRRPDVILFPNYFIQPTLLKTKKVAFIHDLGFKLFPESLSPRNLHYLQKYMPYIIRRSDKIITISENSKQQLADIFGVSSGKINIISPAVDHGLFYPQNTAKISKVLRKYHLPSDYILFVSTLEPRKNIVRLLHAYEALPKNIQQKHPLVLVGGRGWQDDEIMSELERLKDLPIIRPGYVSDEDLPAIYSGAKLFVFPSLYEGFGIPPLEAMTCGTPVITADNSSLPEVCGKAALYINAEDTDQITDAVQKVLKDKHLAKRMSEAGLVQARNFSWEQSAEDLLGLLRDS